MLRNPRSEDLEAPAEQIGVVVSPSPSADRAICRSITWIASCGEHSRPILRGDMELADLGPARTQLALSAQYQPFTHHASAEERMGAQRIGESTLKAFVDRLADYVAALLNGGTTLALPVDRHGSGGAPFFGPAYGA
jgi:hypothetical protein